MKKQLVIVVLIVIRFDGGSLVSGQGLLMGGSDTLFEVTEHAIAESGLGASFTYLGGGSSAGELAMIAGTQFVAPMSRELENAPVNGLPAPPTICSASSSQLLLGLDGIVVLAANQINGDSQAGTSSTADDCSDDLTSKTLTGITKADGITPCDSTDGCASPGQYTFGSWREVLAMIYGGMNHNNAPALNTPLGNDCVYTPPPNETQGDGACLGGQVCYPYPPLVANLGATGRCGDPTAVGRRNLNRVNCLSPVRLALVNNYGDMFSDTGASGSCRTGTCVRVKHAFRLDDLSGTTQLLVELIGLPSIPLFTRAFLGSPYFVPIPDRFATANPFCNAGERVMNRGDADYLNLDPIRRSVDHQNTAGTRVGLEQVGEVVPSFGGTTTMRFAT